MKICLQLHIPAVSLFLSHLSLRGIYCLWWMWRSQRETKTLTCCFPTSHRQQVQQKQSKKAGFVFPPAFWSFLTCLSFQGSSAGHEVFFPSVGVVWLAWSYSSSNKDYFQPEVGQAVPEDVLIGGTFENKTRKQKRKQTEKCKQEPSFTTSPW